ncbi:MAG TPA: hypothetical protein VHV31_07095 [Nitrolancea sp.]|jgi:hypothetical protein|nr:hypothetical protein [Nitrolancea sp.]
MLDHSGTSRVRYEDAFRAFGNYLDVNRFTQIVMVETPQGFLIKGQIVSETGTGDTIFSFPQTYLFSNDDIDNLLESAYERRQPRE